MGPAFTLRLRPVNRPVITARDDVYRMNRVSGRAWTAAVMVAFAAVVLAGPSVAEAATFAKPARADARKGIVQSVSPKAIVLRELDGSTVRVPVGRGTRVFVDGKRAALRNVRAGFVASATWAAGRPARVFHAFNLSGPHAVSVGVVDSLSDGVLAVTLSDGGTLSIPVVRGRACSSTGSGRRSRQSRSVTRSSSPRRIRRAVGPHTRSASFDPASIRA